MPGYSYIQADVKCPFYQYDDGRRKIICEGFTDRCAVDLRWRFHTEQVLHLQTFCCREYDFPHPYHAANSRLFTS